MLLQVEPREGIRRASVLGRYNVIHSGKLLKCRRQDGHFHRSRQGRNDLPPTPA
jgi:hypothetical protein